MTHPTTLIFKSDPDGLGFIYGSVVIYDNVHRVDLLPPASAMAMPVSLERLKPDATRWIGYIDGVEIVRAPSRAALEEELVAFVTRCVEVGCPI